MSNISKIEWTDATWNPVTGCTKIGPGCAFCYAERFAERFRGASGHPYQQGFDLRLWPNRIKLPLFWKEPRHIFVNSMSDLFHSKVPNGFISKIFETMTQANQHIFQVLTKRSERMMMWCQSKFLKNIDYSPHIWLGVSVENQNYVWRIRHLQRTPAKIRFLSIEPMLGQVKLNASLLREINWVIVGGESGPKARPMKPDWVCDVREQCQKYKIPFFFKQWGTFNSAGQYVGKKNAGRILDGRVWDEMPTIRLREEISAS